MEHDTNRRSFLGFAIFGLGAIFSAIIGIPVTLYVIDPRHRTPPKSQFKRVDGIKLDEITQGAKPRQGVILDTRRDGWTLYPNDVVGRVWVVQWGPRPANLSAMTSEELENFNANTAHAAYLGVFTTICPHLGCSVNLDDAGGFLCPCHSAKFSTDGSLVAPAHNPAARGMDTLEWNIDPSDPERNRIVVKYERYKATLAKKELV